MKRYLMLVLMGLLTGCVTPEVIPVREKGPSDEEVHLQAIKEMKAFLRRGMTIEEFMACGLKRPVGVIESVNSLGQCEHWRYPDFLSLFFVDGKLESWQIQ